MLHDSDLLPIFLPLTLPFVAAALPLAATTLPIVPAFVPTFVKVYSFAAPHLICNHLQLRWNWLFRPYENIDKLSSYASLLGHILEEDKRVSCAICSSACTSNSVDVVRDVIHRINHDMRDIWNIQASAD